MPSRKALGQPPFLHTLFFVQLLILSLTHRAQGSSLSSLHCPSTCPSSAEIVIDHSPNTSLYLLPSAPPQYLLFVMSSSSHLCSPSDPSTCSLSKSDTNSESAVVPLTPPTLHRAGCLPPSPSLSTEPSPRVSVVTSEPETEAEPPAYPLSFPRTLYSDNECAIWPVTTAPAHYAVRGAWSARLASREWWQAKRRGDDAALADPALFTGCLLDSALERSVPSACGGS